MAWFTKNRIAESEALLKGPDTPLHACVSTAYSRRVHWLSSFALVLLTLSAINADHFPPWTAFHSEAPAFAAGALLLIALAAIGQVRMTSAVLLMAAMLGSVWLQWAAGVVKFAGDAWLVTAYLLVFAAAWLWGTQCYDRRIYTQMLTHLGRALIFMALFTSFVALAQWLRVESYWSSWVNYGGPTHRSISNLGQPNLAGTLLLMGVAAIGISVTKGEVSRWVAWLALAMFGWCVVLTQSRTALLSTAVMVGLLCISAWKRKELRKFCPDSVIFLLYVLLGSWLLQNIEWGAVKSGIGQSQMMTVGLRPLLWEQIARGLMQSPWVGYGWLQTAAAQQVGALQRSGIEQASFAHNAILDLMVWVGIPVGMAVLWLSARWGWTRLQRLHFDDPAAAGLFLIVPLLVHMQLELPHTYAFFLVPAGVVLGAFDAATTSGSSISLQLSRKFVVALAILTTFLLAVLAREYLVAEEDHRVNRFENRRLGVTPSGYNYPDLVFLTQLDAMLKAMRLRAVPEMSDADLRILADTSKRYTWAPMLYRTALAHALNNRPAEAEQYLRTIKNMFPADIYEEGQRAWLDMQRTQYPQLASVTLP